MVCVVIPVLNEVENIESLTERLLQALGKTGKEYMVLFVDDGSTDGTREFIQQQIVQGHSVSLLHRIKQGKGCKRGAALYDGMKWALEHIDVRYFIEMDGDLSHQPEEIAEGIQMLERNYDVVIASKYLHSSRVIGRPWHRNLFSKVNSLLLRGLLSTKITDYSNGFRFYNTMAAKVILSSAIHEQGPLYLGEVLSIWMKHNLRITEVPSVYTDRRKGKTKVIVRDVLKGFTGALSVAYRHNFTR